MSATDDDAPTVVTVRGEVDLATAPELRQVLEATTGDLVVDLAQVTFMDSSGLGVLVAARKRTAAAGQRFTVRNETDLVARTMTLTGVFDYLHGQEGESP